MKRILYTISLIVSLGAFAQTPIADYTFTGNANDGSVNGFNGTATGATLTADRFGVTNSAYSFDGVDDNISIPDNSALDFASNDFSISFWMNSTNSTDNMRLVSKGSRDSSDGYMVRTASGTVFVELNGVPTGASIVSVTDGIWHMVTVVIDRDTDSRVYIDGTLDNQQTINTAALDLTNAVALTFGIDDIGTEDYDGSLDHVRIYDQVLSALEVSTLYEDDLLIADYSFTGNTEDESGNGHDGTVSGATPTTDRFGIADNAYFFGGSSTITFENTSTIDYEDEITVAAWINSSVYGVDGAGEPEFVSNGISSAGFDFKLSGGTSDQKGLKAEVFGGGGFLVAGDLDLNTWYHVAFTYQRNESLILFVNGQEIGRTAATDQSIAASTRDLVSGSSMNGSIDELTVYDRTLSATEIAEVFSSSIETEPADQPTNMVFANNSGACFSYDFTASTTTDISGYLHVFRAVEAPDFVPQDGVTYTADVGTPISGDNFIASVGDFTTGNLCSQPNTTYFYEIYAYNGSGPTINYLTDNPLTSQITTIGSPTFTSFTPTLGNEGDLITITGTNFSETSGNNEVIVGGKIATIDGTPTNESITVNVPDNATSGPVSVRVGVGFATGGSLTATSSEDFIREDPHVRFTFSGNTLDDSGNGYDGTASGGASLTTDRFGTTNSAFSFDGIDGAVTTSDLGVQPTQLTMSTWFYYEAGAADGTHQLMEIPSTAALALSGGQFQGVLNLNDNFEVISIAATPGEWHFGAMTYDGSTFSTYLDGVLLEARANTDQILYPNAANILRMGESFGENRFNGKLDEVQLHGRALSAGEISTIYSEGTLVAQYNFDTGAALDITGNGYDGVAMNGAFFGTDRFGTGGGTFEPEGNGTHISINHNSEWDMQGQVTLSGWIRPNSLPVEGTEFGHVIFRETEFGELDVAPNGSIFYHWNQASGNFAALGTAAGTIENNQWSMVSLVIGSNDYVKIYIDGKLQKVSLFEGVQNVDSIQITRHAGVGVSADFGDAGGETDNRWFSGSIDDFRVYVGKALCASELTTIYESEISGGLEERVAYFPFTGGDQNDQSGNSYGGEFNDVNNSAATIVTTTGRFGEANGALLFDNTGNSNHVFHERSINLSNDFTVNMWVNPNSFASTGQLGDVLIANGLEGRFMTFENGILAYHYPHTNNVDFPVVATDAGVVSLSEWQMVTYSIDSDNNVSIYHNGQQVVTGDVSNQILGTPDRFILAQPDDATNGDVRFYDGAMDDVTIYQRTLSAEEIAGIFTNNILVADYPFNGNANDESGNGNDATANGASLIADRSGNVGSAFAFDGTDDYLERVSSDALLFGLEQASVSLWVNTNSITKIQDILNTGTTRFYLNEEGRVVSELFVESGGMGAGMATVPLVAGIWNHIVLTYDGSKARLYRNADEAVVNDSNGKLVSVNSGTTFIGSNDGASSFMDGEIDDIKIYNHALSETEIVALYNEGGSNANDIVSFTINDKGGAVNANAHTVSIDVPFGTDRSSLTPTIVISDLASINPASGVARDFSEIVTYTVTAEDGSTQDWQVFLTVLANTEAEFKSFSVNENEASIDIDNMTVTGEVAFGTDEATLIAVFELSNGATASIDGNEQTSNSTVNNFTIPKTYRITAADGITFTDWIVTVTVASADAKEIIAFSFPEQEGSTSIDSGNETVELDVVFGTNVEDLVADFALSGGAVASVGGNTQTSGQTPNNFTSPVDYVVTASDASTKNWTVTVEVGDNTATDITTFKFDEQVGSETIDADNHTVTVSRLFGTDVSSLTPNTIDLSTGATISPDASTAQDFTNAVTYTVTAQNVTITQDWSVFVVVLSNSAPTALELDNMTVAENRAAGTSVGTFMTTDSEIDQTYTYTLISGTGDTNNSDFQIVGDQLQTAEILALADGATRSVLVQTDDGNGGQFPQAFEITVTESVNVDSDFSSFITPGSQAEEGQPFQIGATVTDVQGVNRVDIYHRRAGTGAFSDPETMTAEGDVYSYSMADANLSAQGVQYFLRAVDEAGKTVDTGLFFTAKTVGETSENLPTSTVRAGITVQDYRIVAFPYVGLSVNALTDDLGAVDATNWRLLQYDGASSDPFYRNASSLSPGSGYWLIFKEYTEGASSIDVGGPSVSVNESGVFTMNLREGLNLIGNPFKGVINWTGVLTHNVTEGIVADGDVSAAAGYNGSYVARSTLSVFEGAFISVTRTGGVQNFEIPVSAISGRTTYKDETRPQEAFVDNTEWNLRFFFETPSYSYKMGSIGMKENALDDSDKFDFPLLPKFSTYLEQVFADGNTGSVKRSDHFKKWTFQVPNNLPESEINLTWDVPVSSRKTILLVDGASNKVYDLSKTRSINLPNNPSATHRIYYGDEATIWDNIDLPFDVLYSVYPNPVENQFTLEVYAAEDKNVKVELISLSGRATSLGLISLQKGLSSRKMDLSQSDVKNGIYFIKVDGKVMTKIFKK